MSKDARFPLGGMISGIAQICNRFIFGQYPHLHANLVTRLDRVELESLDVSSAIVTGDNHNEPEALVRQLTDKVAGQGRNGRLGNLDAVPKAPMRLHRLIAAIDWRQRNHPEDIGHAVGDARGL